MAVLIENLLAFSIKLPQVIVAVGLNLFSFGRTANVRFPVLTGVPTNDRLQLPRWLPATSNPYRRFHLSSVRAPRPMRTRMQRPDRIPQEGVADECASGSNGPVCFHAVHARKTSRARDCLYIATRCPVKNRLPRRNRQRSCGSRCPAECQDDHLLCKKACTTTRQSGQTFRPGAHDSDRHKTHARSTLATSLSPPTIPAAAPYDADQEPSVTFHPPISRPRAG